MLNSKLLYIVTCFALLMACGKMPETHYFTLEWQQLSEQTAAGKGILHIQNFDAAPMLKYDKMMYKTSRYEVKYDNFRRWVMTPNSLLTQKAAEYYTESGFFDNVVLDVPRGKDSLSLFGRVNKFLEINYDGEHNVFISISFEVTNFDQREPLLNTTIDKKVPINGSTVEDIVAAMSQATKLVFDDLTNEIGTLLE